VLDVGCGTGFATEGILRRTDDVHGLDQSVHQMQKAFAKFGKRDRVAFYRGDAERLPFADDAFDVVWSSGSIEYWPNPVDALVEFRRVCKPGGKVLVVGPDQPKTSLFSRLADAIMLFYDEDEADRMFAAAGFEEFEHHIQQARPGSPRAITTLARVPAENGDGGRSTVDRESDRERTRDRDRATGPTSDAGTGSASSAGQIGD
jgi:demethylmenaquinone methyltransferase/2-methoxy-6-polyprenyl-1,4-benzoquinol methylase